MSPRYARASLRVPLGEAGKVGGGAGSSPRQCPCAANGALDACLCSEPYHSTGAVASDARPLTNGSQNDSLHSCSLGCESPRTPRRDCIPAPSPPMSLNSHPGQRRGKALPMAYTAYTSMRLRPHRGGMSGNFLIPQTYISVLSSCPPCLSPAQGVFPGRTRGQETKRHAQAHALSLPCREVLPRSEGALR